MFHCIYLGLRRMLGKVGRPGSTLAVRVRLHGWLARLIVMPS